MLPHKKSNVSLGSHIVIQMSSESLKIHIPSKPQQLVSVLKMYAKRCIIILLLFIYLFFRKEAKIQSKNRKTNWCSRTLFFFFPLPLLTCHRLSDLSSCDALEEPTARLGTTGLQFLTAHTIFKTSSTWTCYKIKIVLIHCCINNKNIKVIYQ